MMSIPVTCRQCGRRYELPEHLAGQRGRCVCGVEFAIPARAALAAPATPVPPAPAPSPEPAPAPPRRLLARWQTLPLWHRLLLLTVPVALAFIGVLLHRYAGRGTSIGSPLAPPLAVWTWLLCPLTGLMILRILMPRGSLTPRVLVTGFLLGVGWAAALRLVASLVVYLPLAVRISLAVSWDTIWCVSVAGMVVGAPWFAAWAALQERPGATPARWLGWLWRIGDRSANPVHGGTAAFAWALSALAVLHLSGLFRTGPASAPGHVHTVAYLAGLVTVVSVALAGMAVNLLVERWRLGPYALTAAYCGALAAVTVSVAVWRPGGTLLVFGLLLLLAATALGALAGSVMHRGAALGSRSFDLAAACAVGMAVIILGFAMTPSLQTQSILSLAREGRKGRLATEAVGRLRGPAGVRTLLELIEIPQRDRMARLAASGAPPPALSETIPDLGQLVKAADDRLTALGTAEPMLLLSLLPGLEHGERAFLIAHVTGADDRRLVPALLEILAGKLPAPPAPQPPQATRSPQGRGSRFVYRLPYLGPWLTRRALRSPASPGGSAPGLVWSGSMPPVSVSSTGPEGVQAAAASALGKLGDRQAIQPLIAALALKPPVSGAAAGALVELKDPVAAEPLRRVLLSPDRATRAAAAEGMALFRYQAAVPELLALLRTDDVGQAPVCRALAELNVREAIPQLRWLLTTTRDDATAHACCEALERLGASPLDALIQIVLRNEEFSWARFYLREKYRHQATARLARFLDDPAHQAAAAEALRLLDTDEARAALSQRGLAVSRY